MNSRTLVNLLLLAVVAVLGLLAYYQPGLEDDTQKTAELTAIKPADVAKIRIERADAGHLAFERRDGKWWMTEPVVAPANEVRMEGVLRIGATKSLRHYPTAQVDLTNVGLDQPEVLLVFDNNPPIAFGDVEPLTQQRYVRVGDTVHLVEDSGYYHVIGAYPTFLDGALLPEGAQIEGLTLPGLKLARVQDRWRVDPQPARFSVDQVNELLDEWRHTQAADLRGYSGGKPLGEIRVQLKEQPQPLRFTILSRAPELVLARTDLGLEYHLPADAAKRLLSLPEPPADDAAAPAK